MAGLTMLAVFAASSAFGNSVPQLGFERTVTNTNSSGAGSLSDAILQANSSNTGDTIVFDSGVTGTITLTAATLEIVHSMTIIGPGASQVAISGAGNFQVFLVDAGATVSISGLTIEQGTGNGGGIGNSGTLTLTNSTVSGNFATSHSGEVGGGILNVGTLTVTNSTVSGNTARSAGGGIGNEQGTVTINNSTISGNVAQLAAGGGIVNFFGATLTATNSTFSGNTAVSGGGIENVGTLTLTNSTLSGNSAASNGGGIDNDSVASATLKNTIVANNPFGGNCASSGMFTSAGHNLSDDTTCGGVFIGIGDLNNSPAGLDPAGLRDNGGPTQTIALLATSPAVDAVSVSPANFCTALDLSPITTDQRGGARPQGPACDIGAFELAVAPVAGKLAISPARLNFGAVKVNQARIKLVKILNAGHTSKKNHPLPIVVQMESVTGTPAPSPFSVSTLCSNDELQPAGKGVPPSATFCKVAVQFEPTQAVSYTGTLTIFDNLEPNQMQTVPLTGRGKAAK